MPHTARPLFATVALLCVSFATLWQGCSTPHRDFSDQLAEHQASSPKQPTMAGEETFFDGQLLVEVKLGRGFRPRFKKSVFEPTERYNPFSQSEPGEEEKPRYQSIADDEEMFIPRMHNSILPPQALRLRVTNESAEPIEVAYLECNSTLGNFAVRPESATIGARESHEPQAMISLLGASGEDLPVKITLRRAGKVETKNVVMKLIAPTTPPRK